MHMDNIGLEFPQASAHRLFGEKTVYATEKGSDIPQPHTRNFGTAATEMMDLVLMLYEQSRKALYHSLFAAEFAVFIMNNADFHRNYLLRLV